MMFISHLAAILGIARWPIAISAPEHRTSDVEHRTSDVEHRTSDVGFRTSPLDGLAADSYAWTMWRAAENAEVPLKSQYVVAAWGAREESDFSFQLLSLLASNPGVDSSILDTIAALTRARWSADMADELLVDLCASQKASPRLLAYGQRRMSLAQWDTAGRLAVVFASRSPASVKAANLP